MTSFLVTNADVVKGRGTAMFAQVSKVQIQPGKIDEAIGIFQDSVLPVVKEQKGFKKFYLLVDRSGDKLIVANFWETEADVAALLESGFYREQVAKFAAVFAGPPQREVYEVGITA